MVAAAGVHLQLWVTAYSPVAVIGPLFLADVVASCLVAVAVLVWRHPLAAAAGIAIELGAIAGLALASTTGLFGFQQVGSGVGVQIALAYATESVGAVLLAASVVLVRRPRAPDSAPRQPSANGVLSGRRVP